MPAPADDKSPWAPAPACDDQGSEVSLRLSTHGTSW